MEKTVKYVFSKETKSTYVFTSDLGVYYLPKTIFDSKPAEITVTIKA